MPREIFCSFRLNECIKYLLSILLIFNSNIGNRGASGLNQKLREKNAQLAKLYSEKLHAEAQENFIAAYLSVDFDACKTIAETLCADDNFSAVLFCNESDRLRYICARGKNGALDCRTVAQKINALLGAKGGGSPVTSQGSCPKTAETEQKLREILSEPVQKLN